MKNHFIAGWCMALFGIAQCAFAQPTEVIPEKVYRIHCGDYSTQQEADICASKLNVQNMLPIKQEAEDGTFSVYAGSFDTNSEAWAYSKMLKNFGVLKYDVQSLENESGADFDSEFHAGVPRLIVPRAENAVYKPKNISRDTIMNDPKGDVFFDAMEDGDPDLIISAGASLIEQLDDSDALKGCVMLETARCIAIKEKKSGGALPYLLSVGKCETRANQQDMIEAQFMVADSWHYYWTAPLKGYRAYKEILNEHGEQHPQVKARCMVEMAACLLELAQMPDREWVAEYDDVRRYALRGLEEIPTEYRRARAQLEQIYAQSFIYEARDARNEGVSEESVARRNELYQLGLDAYDGFQERYAGRTREVSMANHMEAWLLGMTGDWQGCKALLMENLEKDYSDPKESFYHWGNRWNMKRMAADRGREFARQFRDQEAIGFFEDYLANENYLEGSPDLTGYDTAYPHSFFMEAEL